MLTVTLAATLTLAAPPQRHTTVTVVGDAFHVNGRPTYEGRYWNGHKIEGLLLNSRMVQATFDDRNGNTRPRWAYPDTGTWDAERNLQEFLAALPEYRRHGLLAVTLNLQGGSPQGYSQEQPWHNSAIEADGSLRPDYMARFEKVLDKTDELGMVVILGLFYFGQDERIADEAAVNRAVDNAIDWLFDRGYKHVLIEVNNECDVKYDHEILKPKRVHELIDRVKAIQRGGRRFLAGTSYGGGRIPDEAVVRSSDFLLLHGNGVSDPDKISEMVRQTRAVAGYTPKPILFNEDDHFHFDQPKKNFTSAILEYASWGYFDFRMRGESFDDGFQSVPVNWSISSPRKKGFFKLLAEITGSSPEQGAMKPDEYRYAGLPPERAAEVMTVPEGFRVHLFAGEPDVTQPVAFCTDDRGRLWVAEAHSYPRRQPEGKGKDRILIFEDADGDGRFDKRTVFMENLNLVSGLEVGFDGVWIGAAPHLLFVPWKAGADEPAAPPRVLLDGWGYEDTHETLNTFTWGPDGWLYGCHGVFTHSRVGKPGTPHAEREPLNAGVWRYHPTRHVFEVVSHGTSNPWGLDFDRHGQIFVEACVIPHNWHLIPGGRYHRQAGDHFNPYTYADIQTIATHRHFVGGNPHGGNNHSDSAGGGHAHCGALIYQGGSWPQRYHGLMFMGNIHGHRLNVDRLTRRGSGYVATREPDFLLANDSWARFINLRHAPDGNVYLIDWYDKQACHHNNPDVWDRGNGRIYKICHGGAKAAPVNLNELNDMKLAELQQHSNVWHVRHSRRLLQERKEFIDPAVLQYLSELALRHDDPVVRLRGLWSLHVVDQLQPAILDQLLDDRDENVRGWAARIALQGNLNEERLQRLAQLAANDPSPVVRRDLAGELQRRPHSERQKILTALLDHGEDAADHNLPLLYWYALEPLTDADPGGALRAAVKFPRIVGFIARKVASSGSAENLDVIVRHLATIPEHSFRRAVVSGLQDGLRGKRTVKLPQSWPTAYAQLTQTADEELKRRADALALQFGDQNLTRSLRIIVSDPKESVEARRSAIHALARVKDGELPSRLIHLLEDAAVRPDALKALAAVEHPNLARAVLKIYDRLSPAEKRDALVVLTARAATGRALLDAIEAGQLPAADLPADLVRQLRSLGQTDIDEKVARVWGLVRATPADRAKLMADVKKMVLNSSTPPDVHLGRSVYAKTCQQCHQLYGTGGKVGPDITGANRSNLDYLLENILDPSAVIPKEYMATRLQLDDGRVVIGIVGQETANDLTIVTANDTLTIGKGEIAEKTASDISMMPDDQLASMTPAEVRGLFAYLQTSEQVPLLLTKDNAADFFNGRDLTNWFGNFDLWKVENGEIVGSSPGLKRNEFLKSVYAADNFRLSLKVKLTPDTANSGIQFRSRMLPDGDVAGLQADIGAGWWGKLYDEHGRGLLWDKPTNAVKPGEWNEYVIEADGPRVRTWINGVACVDFVDETGPRRGQFALQMHSDAKPQEVRFRDVILTVR